MKRIVQLKTLILVLIAPCFADGGVLNVVTTTTMITDMVKDVGGERVQVRGLMGPEVDPHSYRANRSDVLALRRADVIFYNGHFLEGAMADVLTRLQGQGRAVYALAEAVVPHTEGEVDPHVWLDPRLWARAVDTVVAGLSRAQPEHAEYFAGRGALLAQRYAALYDWAVVQIATIPEERRVLITSHDAFGYFGEAFGVEVVGLQGISTVSEAGLGDIRRLAGLIRERQIPAIFLETSISPRLMERVRELADVRIGGVLFSDAMGAPGEMKTVAGQTLDTGTFEGMFKFNVLTLVEGLGQPNL